MADPFPSHLSLFCNRIKYSSMTTGYRPMQRAQECTHGARTQARTHARCTHPWRMRRHRLIFKLYLLQGMIDQAHNKLFKNASNNLSQLILQECVRCSLHQESQSVVAARSFLSHPEASLHILQLPPHAWILKCHRRRVCNPGVTECLIHSKMG